MPGSPAADQQTEAVLARLAERVDAYERHRPGHASRVAVLAERLARAAGLPDAEVADVRQAALGHGLGLYHLRLGALERSGPLTLVDRIELWRHPLLAEQQLAKRGGSRHAQLVVRWHHEWWNGQGYPDMLSGDGIPLGARILRLAESYDALSSDRPHRGALDPLEARRAIADGAGVEFDPVLAAMFLRVLEESAVEPERAEAPPPRLAPIRSTEAPR